VMVCFVASHYTAKAFFVFWISIWGFGQQEQVARVRVMLSKTEL